MEENDHEGHAVNAGVVDVVIRMVVVVVDMGLLEVREEHDLEGHVANGL